MFFPFHFSTFLLLIKRFLNKSSVSTSIEMSVERSPPSLGDTKDVMADEKQLTSEVEVTDRTPGIVIEDGLRRGLLGRHVSLISLASVIGASCFYGFGYALYESGPLGALLGFGIVGTSARVVSLSSADFCLHRLHGMGIDAVDWRGNNHVSDCWRIH